MSMKTNVLDRRATLPELQHLCGSAKKHKGNAGPSHHIWLLMMNQSRVFKAVSYDIVGERTNDSRDWGACLS